MYKKLVLPAMLAAALAHADSVVLDEKFDNDLNTLWIGQNGDGSVPMHATIVDDPLRPGNKVVRFDKPVFGGDIFTKEKFPEGKYTLSFEYLGTCGFNCGGVIGYTSEFPGRDNWLAGTASSGFPEHIKDTKKWESYSFDFKGRFDFHLSLEQWVQSNGSGGDIYFDNVKLVRKGDGAGKGAAAPAPKVATVGPNDAPAGKGAQLVFYFPSWGTGRGYWVKHIEQSGTAKKATVIQYAFGNVVDNKCTVGIDKAGVGSAALDYWDPVPAEHTLDGKPDQGDKGLFGHWNQIKQLKKKYPQLKVVISLGGWNWSKHFSDAALPANRQAFVKSCIDAYIKGNVPTRDGKLIEGLAAGVFDGIDVDWEYPASQGAPGNVVRPEDKQNFTALLNEFRKQLDAVKPGYLLTIATGAPSNISSNMELDQIHKPLNWINVMTYDYAGPWSNKSGHLATLYGSAAEITTAGSIKEYIEGGVPPQKLVVGVPFYGYGWVLSKTDNNGMGQPIKEKAKGTYDPGTAGYDDIKAMPGQVFRDERTKAVWKLNGSEMWVYDDIQALKEKVEFVKKQQLGGIMAWELVGDTPDGELVDTLYQGLRK
ncbi:glycoside hydrolase family 18 protein [Chitiniphilus purpureus]|uniref:chitinase n=1 Tax=Chitiniphilus purpureus TaxID=2981137 RepID=A0ABY6DIU0_9NEIS|nr:glycoside hydrolase family 18 protein [Chitiniphilus sp. CD1]UXY14265.1 glycoside hydrolase family 18 protein [Chitiniphilus sp. CD1]